MAHEAVELPTFSPPYLTVATGVPPKPATPNSNDGSRCAVPEVMSRMMATPLAISAAPCSEIAAISQGLMKSTVE